MITPRQHAAEARKMIEFANTDGDDLQTAFVDALADMMHLVDYAPWTALGEMGFAEALRIARDHYEAERLVSCRKCGRMVPQEDAIVSDGTGPELGKTFLYCSDDCETTH